MRTIQDVTRYIFPPRAETAVPREATDIYARHQWWGQLKYNDSHILIKYLPATEGTASAPKIELWNRHGDKLRDYHPTNELTEQLHALRRLLNLDPDRMSLIDGGLLDKKHAAIKDTIVIWDLLVKDGVHLLDTTYAERYQMLYTAAAGTNCANGSEQWVYSRKWKGREQQWPLGLCLTPDIFMPQIIAPDKWDETWLMIADINLPWTEANGKVKSPLIEGLIFKDPTGRLESGFSEKNNSSWISRSRVWTGRHRY